ncbi:MAG TPA: hypothetical protein PK683_03240 [Leptospiraceae bacterium]|nr:hypothetical protein [Leptospiraceae bacterium]
MILFESTTAKTEYLPEKNMIVLTQQGKNVGESLKKCLDIGLDALIKNKAYKWLSDNRFTQSVRGKEDAEWVNNDWTPRALKAGWKKWALIQPKSALTSMAEQQFVDFFAENGIEVKIFDTPEEGFAWLDTV